VSHALGGVLAADYAEESRRCDEAVAAHALDDLAVDAPATSRGVLHHLVEETARHLGHLDPPGGRTGEEPVGGTSPG
jgi:hypothetical protein